MMQLTDMPAMEVMRDRIVLHIALSKAEIRPLQKILNEIGTSGHPEKFAAQIKRFRKKRSLDANAYYWVLVGEIAKAIGSTDIETHNWLLMDYGEPMRTADGDLKYILMRDDADYMRSIDTHVRPTDVVENRNGVTYRWFIQMKGSRFYDTAEMARLIDGTVQEAKELGIETLTPDQLEEIKQKWRIDKTVMR